MKKLMVIVWLFCALKGRAQSQELKQLSLNMEKLAQLKSMLTQMYQGYTILDKGYNNIKELSQGNFSLHKTFLDGLLKVSPSVRSDKKIADIIVVQASLVKEYKAAIRQCKELSVFHSSEADNICTAYTNLFNRCVGHLEELSLILTDGALRMNDAERLKAIDHIAVSMNEKLTELHQLKNRVDVLAAQRLKNEHDTKLIKSLY